MDGDKRIRCTMASSMQVEGKGKDPAVISSDDAPTSVEASHAHPQPSQQISVNLPSCDPSTFSKPASVTQPLPQLDGAGTQLHERSNESILASPFKHDWESSSNEEESRNIAPDTRSVNSTSTTSSIPPRLTKSSLLSPYHSSNATSKAVTRQPSAQQSSSSISRLTSPFDRHYSRYPTSGRATNQSSSPKASRSPVIPPVTTPHAPPTPAFGASREDVEKWGFAGEGLGGIDPYAGSEEAFILYINEKEADDDDHMPAENEKDDDRRYRPKVGDYMHCKTLTTAIGAVLLVLGLIFIFIILPLLAIGKKIYDPQMKGGAGGTYIDYGPAWARVNNNTYPLNQNVRRGLIDEDTPRSAYTRQSTFDSSVLKLVFSDEFNTPNRTFYPGDDPYWTAPDIWYGATQDLEWYDPDAVTTANGTLQLKLERFPNHNLDFRSGMLNSWNQMCFKGGIFEVSVSLAGPSGVPGLWPGAWAMGNLGRPGYKATTEGVWPYTYNSCDYGITPNQSSPDGLSHLPGQKLSSCTCNGQDHPSPGTGRGAPEIDILEGSVDPNNLIGVVTQSAQVAPFDIWYRPNNDFLQIPNYNTTQMNGYCGGPFQQAVSGTTLLNNDWYDNKFYQKYAFEYIPGTNKGKIAWFVGDYQTFMMDGRAVGPNGNVNARLVSEEPMSLILNLGISNSWSEIRMGQLKFPTIMHIDYVRIYQKEGEEMITCDPPGYPTTKYIADHPKAYRNPNLTVC